MRALIAGGVVVLVLATSAPAGAGPVVAWPGGPLAHGGDDHGAGSSSDGGDAGTSSHHGADTSSGAPPANQEGSDTATTDNPFERARAAARSLTFTGTVNVDWEAADGRHSERLVVRAAGGSLQVEGASTVMAKAEGARMVRRPGGEWDLLWSGPQTRVDRPHPSEKYDLVTRDPGQQAVVVSRPAEVVEIRQAGVLRERLYVDAEKGLLLKREQLDSEGRARRVVAFSSIDFGTVNDVALPSHSQDHSPRRLSAVSVPSSLPGGYRKVDAYRDDDTDHVLYSDGLYDLSVFRQKGSLDSDELPPAGRRVQVGSGRGWVYGWPGGQVLVWQAGRNVYSLVSKAPVEDLLGAARALPNSGDGSLISRMRRVCHNLLEPLSA